MGQIGQRSITFTDKEKDIFDFLLSKGGVSKYLKGLLRYEYEKELEEQRKRQHLEEQTSLIQAQLLEAIEKGETVDTEALKILLQASNQLKEKAFSKPLTNTLQTYTKKPNVSIEAEEVKEVEEVEEVVEEIVKSVIPVEETLIVEPAIEEEINEEEVEEVVEEELEAEIEEEIEKEKEEELLPKSSFMGFMTPQ